LSHASFDSVPEESHKPCPNAPMVRTTWSEQRDTGRPLPAALQYLDGDVTAHPRWLLWVSV
jgi:hypothetical protein